MFSIDTPRKVAVVGLGYVGLPVAMGFGASSRVVGFDINKKRIAELKKGFDRNNEVFKEEFKTADVLFTDNPEDLKQANFFIITVPTPINNAKQPDLTPMYKASETISRVLKKGDIVVYESTVYPGVTEDECVPILEKFSGIKCGQDFKVGYSPERINPGDREHRFEDITKVVSGMDPVSTEIVARTYERVVKAGVFRAASIKVAEAAKVIENTQRDLNIALFNELSLIFDRMGIDTQDVLDAAGTKWNFLKFRPGLVGGHCIGVDPYYLTHKAERLGYHPQVILAGRLINDNMGKFIASRTVKEMIHAGHGVLGSKVIVLGMTFKEDCPDIRNTRVIDIVRELEDFGVSVQVHDPIADSEETEHEYQIKLVSFEKLVPADAVIIAVAHEEYRKLKPEDLLRITKSPAVISDVKSIFSKNVLQEAGFRVWRL